MATTHKSLVNDDSLAWLFSCLSILSTTSHTVVVVHGERRRRILFMGRYYYDSLMRKWILPKTARRLQSSIWEETNQTDLTGEVRFVSRPRNGTKREIRISLVSRRIYSL